VSPASVGTLIVVAVLAVAAPVATGLLWERARGWWRWPARSVALLACVFLAFAVAGVAVNRKLQMYPTWGHLVGAGNATAPVEPPPVPRPSASSGPSPSRIETVTVTGGKNGISLPAYVYLPPGYDGGTRKLPVIEAFAGFPGTPQTWFDVADPRTYVDREIAAGRMPPTIVVFPVQHASPTRDSECVDAAGAARFDSYLSGDVPDFVVSRYRARAERAAWGIVGFSTGGFCAANLALRHPDRYAAAASLSGYYTAITDGTTGDLYRGDTRLRNENSPLWRLGNLPVPAVALYLACASDDSKGVTQLHAMATAARPPLRVTTAVVPSGGHTGAAWQAMTPAALDWLSAQLAGPSLFPAGTQESGESLDGDVTG
jgi:enterochelin esterase-like enzyme